MQGGSPLWYKGVDLWPILRGLEPHPRRLHKKKVTLNLRRLSQSRVSYRSVNVTLISCLSGLRNGVLNEFVGRRQDPALPWPSSRRDLYYKRGSQEVGI